VRACVTTPAENKRNEDFRMHLAGDTAGIEFAPPPPNEGIRNMHEIQDDKMGQNRETRLKRM
jgi:hypothetical protein